MTKAEELLVALMEGDTGPFARFMQTLSDEDLLKLWDGIDLARRTIFCEVMSSARYDDSNSSRLNRASIRRLEERMRTAQADFLRGMR